MQLGESIEGTQNIAILGLLDGHVRVADVLQLTPPITYPKIYPLVMFVFVKIQYVQQS